MAKKASKAARSNKAVDDLPELREDSDAERELLPSVLGHVRALPELKTEAPPGAAAAALASPGWVDTVVGPAFRYTARLILRDGLRLLVPAIRSALDNLDPEAIRRAFNTFYGRYGVDPPFPETR
jgi:hypothetical protein